MQKKRLIVGIDEAGRGPLAGPVAVGAASYDLSDKVLMKTLKVLFPEVRDSKQLTEVRREQLFDLLLKLTRETTLTLDVALISAATIDRHGISHAIASGVARVTKPLSPEQCAILLDGGLQAPPIFVDQKTYVRGDATHLPIALASIAAKVTRDRHMRRIAKRYPGYGFEVHKGYGTKMHYEALRQQGMSVIHRKSFVH